MLRATLDVAFNGVCVTVKLLLLHSPHYMPDMLLMLLRGLQHCGLTPCDAVWYWRLAPYLER